MTETVCPACGGTGWVPGYGIEDRGVRRCECLEAKIKARRDVRVIGGQYVVDAQLVDQKDGRGFTPDEIMNGSQYLAKWNAGAREGLMILGPVGCGKSHYASAIVNALLQLNCRSMTFATVPSLLLEERRKFNAEWNQHDYGYLTDVDMLVLDDLGAEKGSEWTEAFLYTLVQERHGKTGASGFRCPVIATANCSLLDLRDRIGDRTLDRLLGFCHGQWTLMEGESRRWKSRK